jgi:hypothetical protein
MASAMKYLVRGILGFSMLLGATALTARPAMAGPLDWLFNRIDDRRPSHHQRHGVPEIDPAGLAGAIALVAGGTLLLKSRKRKAD